MSAHQSHIQHFKCFLYWKCIFNIMFLGTWSNKLHIKCKSTPQNHYFKQSLHTCCPGLMGDSVIPWVLITGRIWLPITVAIIWPCALVSSCGVIGWTCSEGVPPPDWLECPTEFGIRGIVPMIYKDGREEKIKFRLNYSHSYQHLIYPISKIFLNVFDSLLCSPRLHLFDQKYSKNSNIVKFY